MSKKQRTFPSTTSGFSPQFGLFFSLCPVGESQYKFTGQGLPRRKNERDRGTILGKRKRVDGAPQVRIHAKPLKISSFESAHVPMSQTVVFFILWLGWGRGGGGGVRIGSKLLNVQAGSPLPICLISKEASLDIFNVMLFLSEAKSRNAPE